MANEGSVTLSLTVTKGTFTDSRAASFQFDVAGTPYVASGVQNIGTTHELVAISTDVATLGAGWFTNLDATNYIEIGLVVAATFYPFHRIQPGKSVYGYLAMANNALYAKANTSAAALEFRIYQA